MKKTVSKNTSDNAPDKSVNLGDDWYLSENWNKIRSLILFGVLRFDDFKKNKEAK